MAIIIPDKCRNVTAGALKQVKQTGISTASGGICTSDWFDAFAQTTFLLNKNEPVGIYMTTLEKAQIDMAVTATATMASSKAMADSANEATRVVTEASRKMRDSTEKLGTAMQKFTGIFGSSDFAKKAEAAESLVTSLERLAVLEEKGILAKLMKAMAS